MVADEKFKDWIVVSGSVIGATRTPGPKVQDLGHPQVELFDTYNMAIIQRGNSTERLTHFKKFISSIDFLSAQPNEPNAIVYPNMNLGVELDKPTTMSSAETKGWGAGA